MADPRAELEAREALQQAIQSGDQRAELAAREAIAAAQQRGSVAQMQQSPSSSFGGAVSQGLRDLLPQPAAVEAGTGRREGQPFSTIGGAASLGLGEQILGNIAAIPDVAARGFQGARQLLAGQPGQALEELRTQQLPRPSGAAVNAALAGVEAVPGGLLSGAPIEAFQEAQSAQLRESARTAEERPFATGAGAVAGDALTLLGLRTPGVTARAALPARAAPVAGARQTLGGAVKSLLTAKPVSRLARGTGRAAEAGAEGAVISMLNDGDPLFTAGAAAGNQLAGSAARSALSTGIGKTFGTGFLLLLGARELVPGFDPGVFEAVDTASNKVALAVLVGALGIPGAGRRAGRNQDRLAAVFNDSLNTLPRGVAQSALSAAIAEVQEGGDAIRRVSAAVLKDADSFTREQLQRFDFNNPKESAEALLQDRDFRERLEAVEQASPQQIEADNFRRAVDADVRERRLPKATTVAERLARTLPRDDPRRRGFEGSGPKTFISSLFRGPRPADLSGLNAADRRDVQEVLVQDLIGQSMRRSRGGGPGGRDQVTGVDARQLRAGFLALPTATRESFPARTRDAIEALAGRQIPTIPAPLLAKALMSDGQLVQQLIGDRQQSQRGGLL